MRVACSLFLLLVAFLYPHTVTAEPRPRSVLLLDQGQADPVTIYSEILDIARFNGAQFEPIVREYLRGKYRDRQIGVIVAHGSAALELALRLRDDLWPGVPIVFALVVSLGWRN